MSKKKKSKSINELASTHLGASGSYAVYTDVFDKSLLVGLPREEGREEWGINPDKFHGVDVWHCHESTFLLDNGFPVAGTLKFTYPAYSKYMVESKSMKLYLNSFDMCKMGATESGAIMNYESQVKEDLEKILDCKVEIKFHRTSNGTSNSLINYHRLEDRLNIGKLKPFDDYRGAKKYSVIESSDVESSYFRQTNVLRSRCRHTKQKDTGTFFGYFQGKIKLNDAELFRKIVSMRELDEFHEFCCEKLYKDLVNSKDLRHGMVALLYSRRGSLDINPIRATSRDVLPRDIINVNILTTKTLGQ